MMLFAQPQYKIPNEIRRDGTMAEKWNYMH